MTDLAFGVLRWVTRRTLLPLVEGVGRALATEFGADDDSYSDDPDPRSAVNDRLIPAAFPGVSACDHTQTSVASREDAGNQGSRLILSWPSHDDREAGSS